MSQISPPIRILVIAVLGLVTAYMLILRPKEEPIAASPTPAGNVQNGEPAVTGAGKIAEAAKKAAEASNAKSQQTEDAAGADETAAGNQAAAAKAASTVKEISTGRVLALAPVADKTLDGLPGRVRKALERREVFAIGIFNSRHKSWAPMPADDVAVRNALKKTNRYDGTVKVAMSTLGKLPQLVPVIGDLEVRQSPSVVVVDRNRRAKVLTGYVDRVSINQAIADARRDSTAFRIKNNYLSDLNQVCAQYAMRLDRFASPLSSSPKGRKSGFRRFSRLGHTYTRRFGTLTPPARYKGLHARVMTAMRSDWLTVDAAFAVANAGYSATALQMLSSVDPARGVALDNRFDRLGVTGCVSNRRR